jgi:hypothetical protein
MTTPTPEALAIQAVRDCIHTSVAYGSGMPSGACAACITGALTEQAQALCSIPTDPSRAIAAMFNKLDADDKQAFNFCVVSAREGAKLTTREAAAQIAETIGQRYAEQDASGTRYPAAETCAAVACAVNIAAAIRDAATKGA